MRASPRPVDERGIVGGVEAIAFSVLVFVAGTLLVAGAWGVVDAKGAASTAAREAARAYVEQVDGGNPVAAARTAAADAIGATGRDPTRLQLQLTGGGGRCRRVVAEVAYPVRLGAIPFLRAQAMTMTARARHAELVDPYRSGLDGEAVCAT